MELLIPSTVFYLIFTMLNNHILTLSDTDLTQKYQTGKTFKENKIVSKQKHCRFAATVL